VPVTVDVDVDVDVDVVVVDDRTKATAATSLQNVVCRTLVAQTMRDHLLRAKALRTYA